jgi:hypothetical protein
MAKNLWKENQNVFVMTNEKLYEHYGWKAYQDGFFLEWREETNKRMTDPLLSDYQREFTRAEISAQVYEKLKASRNPEVISQRVAS